MVEYVNKIMNKYMAIPRPAKAVMIFTIAKFITQGLSIITTPIFTRIMTPADIGLVTIFNSWSNIIGVIAGLGLSSGSFNIAMMEYKEKRSDYISSILVLSTISTLFVVAIYILFEDILRPIIGLPSQLIPLLFVGLIFNPATIFWISRQRYEYRYKKTAILTIVSAVLSSLVAVIAVLVTKNSYNNVSLATIRLYGSAVVTLPIAIYIYFYILRKGESFLNKQYWIFALKLSLPLIIHALAKQVLDISDRIMIQKFSGLDKVGIYGILYSVSSLSLIAWGAINSSLIPFIFNKLEQGGEQEKEINKVVNPVIGLYAIICMILILIAPELVKILATEKYYSAIYLMPPIAGGIFFTSLYNSYSNILLYYKKTKLIMISTIIAASVNIILNYIFIPRYGFVAAAYTTLLSFVILAIMQFSFVKYLRQGKELLDDKFLWGISFLVVIFSLVSNILYFNNYLRYVFILVVIAGTLKMKSKIIISLKQILKR